MRHWIEHWNQKLKIKFVLAGWIENPIKSVVLTFPIDKIVFPTVTLCPRDSRPDRWGTAIKIFDQVNTDCGSKRWDPMFNSKANEIILNSLQKFERESNFHTNSSFQLRAILRDFYPMIVNLRPSSPVCQEMTVWISNVERNWKKANTKNTSLMYSIFTSWFQ